ncbi:hypothetical protein [Bdellovibrio sp. BCCA]|uniref:hypothetical protein n=1 Tax=Bdellovibrio sp. BCCA TaxID=3136281 RepID=UPI0030EFCC88
MDGYEKILNSLQGDGLKPEQSIFLAEHLNNVLEYARSKDQVDKEPWRKRAVESWISSPKKAKLLKILKKQNHEAFEIAKSNSQEVLEVVKVIPTNEGVFGINRFDEIILLWPHGYFKQLLDRTFESELIERKDINLIKIAESCLDRTEFDPSRGNASFVNESAIRLDRRIAGKEICYATGVAEKLKVHMSGTKLRYRIVKKDEGYSVDTGKLTLIDVVKPIAATAAVVAVMGVVAKQGPNLVANFDSAMASGSVEQSSEVSFDALQISADERTSVVAAIRDFSFTLDLIGGEPGKETTATPVKTDVRRALNDAVGNAILANFDMEGEINTGYKRNIHALEDFLKLSPQVELAIKGSLMSDSEQTEAIKMLKSAEKRAKYAYEKLSLKFSKFVKASE